MNFEPSLYLEGFKKTQSLLLENEFNLFSWQELSTNGKIEGLSSNQRLGYFAEDLFFQLLKTSFSKQEIYTNIQISNNKITLGELDGLVVDKKQVTHIEFCYKIYLLDPTISDDEFECWVGPNRRDALHQKVAKLKQKQLPLLYHEETIAQLGQNILGFNSLDKRQEVCFLGQLYVPFEAYKQDKTYSYGNANGFYIHYSQLEEVKACNWYIPSTKIDWLLSPIQEVEWIQTEEFQKALLAHYARQSNPLCWIRFPNGRIEKCFVVNWRE